MGVMDNGREWSCSVVVYDLVFGDPTQNNSITAGNSTTYTNTNIKNWKITDTMSANGDVAFGSTGSKALNLELIGLASKSFGTGAIIGVTLTLTGGSSSSWFFFVDEVKWTADFGTTTTYGATVTAYDAMYYANNKISSVTLPSSIQSDISDGKASITSCKTIAQYCIRHARYDLIRTRAEELYAETGLAKYNTYASMYDSNIDDGYTSGKTMDDVCANSTGKANVNSLTGVNNISITTSITGRTLLGRMAAMKGKRAYCNNNSLSNVGKIDWDSLISSNYGLIQKKDVYENGFKAEGKKKFTYFKSGTSSSPATYGKKSSSGLSTMAIDCPDMTNSVLANIASPFKNTEYEIGSVKFRGDPSLKAGMSASVSDASGTTHDVIATKVVSQYDGGFYQQIYSEGKSDSDIEFETNSYDEKAEEIVDDGGGGGGGGGGSLLYYTETTSPNSAQIEVGSNSINVNTTDIDIVGNISAANSLSVAGDINVTGNINCGGTLSYASFSIGTLNVTGTSSFGGDMYISDNKILMEKTVTSGGVTTTYNANLSALKYNGHDIILDTTRYKTVGVHTYTAYNKAILYTLDPTEINGAGAYIAEGEYGMYPQLFLRQGREKDGINQLTPTAVYGLQGFTLAPNEYVSSIGGLSYRYPCGGVSIGISKLSDTESVLRFTFYNTNTNATLGTYTIRKENIAALANLT